MPPTESADASPPGVGGGTAGPAGSRRAGPSGWPGGAGPAAWLVLQPAEQAPGCGAEPSVGAATAGHAGAGTWPAPVEAPPPPAHSQASSAGSDDSRRGDLSCTACPLGVQGLSLAVHPLGLCLNPKN